MIFTIGFSCWNSFFLLGSPPDVESVFSFGVCRVRKTDAGSEATAFRLTGKKTNLFRKYSE